MKNSQFNQDDKITIKILFSFLSKGTTYFFRLLYVFLSGHFLHLKMYFLFETFS